jgi:hypothetical protein
MQQVAAVRSVKQAVRRFKHMHIHIQVVSAFDL